jgi:hypothetical protein
MPSPSVVAPGVRRAKSVKLRPLRGSALMFSRSTTVASEDCWVSTRSWAETST